MSLEIDRLVIIKDRPDTLGAQYLFAFISSFVYVVQQYRWFWSTHLFVLDLQFIYHSNMRSLKTATVHININITGSTSTLA